MGQMIRASLTRRDMLRAAGALIVTAAGPFSMPGTAGSQTVNAAVAFGASKPPLQPSELDSWIAISPDGKITAFFGKTDAGQGTDVAVQQIVAEELDVPFDRVTVSMGDTGVSVNQGGASNSTGIKDGAKQLRYAAAEARRVLVEAAALQWNLPPEALAVEDGIIRAAGNQPKQISYAELVGGKFFHRQVEWNNKLGNPLEIQVRAKPKSVSDYKIVGKSFPRADVTAKVCGTAEYVTDIKVPGMLHARLVRPPVAGAIPVSVNENSVASTGARVVRVKNLLAVVAEKEWDAVRASQALKVTWSAASPPFPAQNDLYDYIRTARPAEEKKVQSIDGFDVAFGNAVKTISVEYEWPLQSHASMGPACAVAEVNGDKVTVYTGSAKPHYAALGVARTLGMKPENVHAIWVRGPGVYGRNDADDAAVAAAVLAKEIGRPIRFQGSREDGTGWDPKSPAGVHSARAAFDKDGNVVAYEFLAKGFSTVDVNSNGSKPDDLLIAQVMGSANPNRKYNFSVPADSYKFPNKQTGWSAIAPMLDLASPLRTSHMRDTTGVQLHFSGESFADEMAYAADMDPVAFRLKYISKPREKAAVQAVAEKANWQERKAPRKLKTANGNYVGQGMAYAYRGGTIVALVVEIEVNPSTGRIWPRKYTVAHDCGLVINPAELTRVVQAGVVQASSRVLFEEVLFDQSNVRSVDWTTYPVIEMPDAPDAIDVVLINRPDVASSGAGEACCRPVGGAIANALFDAIGVRLRRAPLTAARVKVALG